MKIAIITLILTQVMNLIFIGPLKHAGLSLSIGLGACLNASLLYWQLRKQKIFQPQPGWAVFLTKLVIGVVVMSAVLLGLLWVMPAWDVGDGLSSVTVVCCRCRRGIAYFAALALLGFKVRDFARRTS